MKGKNPTRAQRGQLERSGRKSDDWLIQKDTLLFMQIVNRRTGEVEVVRKKEVQRV